MWKRDRKKTEQAKIANRKQRTEQRNLQNRPANTTPSSDNAGTADRPADMDYEIPIEAMLSPEELEEVAIAPTKLKEGDLYYFELDLVRILLNYGQYLVPTKNIEIDEEGNEKEADVEVSVIDLIVHELEKDEIDFKNKIFNAILNEYKEGLKQNILYKTAHFIQHENMEISTKVADIIASKHEISANWLRQKVRITREIDKLDQAVMESIYSFKNKRVKERSDEIKESLDVLYETASDSSIDEQMALLSEKRKWDNLKKILSQKLGRIT